MQPPSGCLVKPCGFDRVRVLDELDDFASSSGVLDREDTDKQRNNLNLGLWIKCVYLFLYILYTKIDFGVPRFWTSPDRYAYHRPRLKPCNAP